MTVGGLAVMAKKRERGRPPKPKSKRQTVRFVVRVTPGEAKLLLADVADAETTTGVFLTELWRQWRATRKG